MTKSRLTLAALLLAAALLAQGSLAAAPTPTASNALPELAQEPRAPRFPCILPLVFGNQDADWDVDSSDAQWLLRRVAGFHLPDSGRSCSSPDIDCDGDTDTVDVLWLLRHVAGLPYTQHEPCPDIGTEV